MWYESERIGNAWSRRRRADSGVEEVESVRTTVGGALSCPQVRAEGNCDVDRESSFAHRGSDDEARAWGELEVVSTRGVDGEVPSGLLALDEALAWARAAADVVVVQASGEQFSAGRVAAPDLPVWDDAWQLRPGRYSYEPPGEALDLYIVDIWATGGPLDPERLLSIERAPGVVRVVQESRTKPQSTCGDPSSRRSLTSRCSLHRRGSVRQRQTHLRAGGGEPRVAWPR